MNPHMTSVTKPNNMKRFSIIRMVHFHPIRSTFLAWLWKQSPCAFRFLRRPPCPFLSNVSLPVCLLVSLTTICFVAGIFTGLYFWQLAAGAIVGFLSGKTLCGSLISTLTGLPLWGFLISLPLLLSPLLPFRFRHKHKANTFKQQSTLAMIGQSH